MTSKRENIKRQWLQDRMAEVLPRLKMVKNHQSALSGSGLPDTFYQQAHLGGVHLEFKYLESGRFNWSKEPTKLQKQTLRELWLAGANVGVIVYAAEWDTWCSVHGEDLITAINAEPWWPCSQMENDYWTMCISAQGIRSGSDQTRKDTIARLVWGRTWE